MKIGYLIAVLASVILGYFIGKFTYNMNNKVVRIENDLRIISSDHDTYSIPKGTKLFYVKPMQEGGDLYKMYLYYKGEPLVNVPSEHRWDMEAVSVSFENGKG